MPSPIADILTTSHLRCAARPGSPGSDDADGPAFGGGCSPELFCAKAQLYSADGGRAVTLASATATGGTPGVDAGGLRVQRNRLNRTEFRPPRRPAQGQAVGSTGVLI
jgi:hypothetical protein